MVLKKIEVEPNSLVLHKNLIDMTSERCWKVKPVIQDILLKREKFEEIKFRWIHKTANKVANWIAKQSQKRMCITNWVLLPPSSLVFILDKDGLLVLP
ncbi:hypothetical protein REPUB_Repub17cG0109600 [Reevesia pubescens]